VLSAVEGLELMEPGFATIVIPVTLGVLALLFFIQRRGTAHISKLFGPIMVLWFVSLAVSGGFAIARQPQVLAALNPEYGIAVLGTHPVQALAIIGAVFLTLTGAEALYADMGHFG
jgi:KUP system potassium uptake protein